MSANNNATLAAFAADRSIDPVTIGVIGFMAVGVLVIWAGYVWLTFFQLVYSLRVIHTQPELVFIADPPHAFGTTLFRLFTRPKPRQYVPWLYLPAKLEANDADAFLGGSPTGDGPGGAVRNAKQSLRLWCDGAASFLLSWPRATETRATAGRALLFATTGDIIDYVRFNVQHQQTFRRGGASALLAQTSANFDNEAESFEMSDVPAQLTGSGWIRTSGDIGEDDEFVGGVVMTITEPTETPLSTLTMPRPVSQMIGFCLSREQAEQMAFMIDTSNDGAAVLSTGAHQADPANSDTMHAMAWVISVRTIVQVGAEPARVEQVVLCYACDCVGQGIVPNTAPHRARAAKPSDAAVHHEEADLGDAPDGRCATPPPEAIAALSGADRSVVDDERELYSACSDDQRGMVASPARSVKTAPASVERVSTPLTPALPSAQVAEQGHRALWDARTGRFVADQTTTGGTDSSFGYIDVVPRLLALCLRGSLYTVKPVYNAECLDVKSHPTTPAVATAAAAAAPHQTPTRRHASTPQTATQRHSHSGTGNRSRGFQDACSDSEDELDEIDDALKCIVCFAHRKVVVTVPCLHFNLCPQCAAKLDQCPECRSVIEAKIVAGV